MKHLSTLPPTMPDFQFKTYAEWLEYIKTQTKK